MHRPIAYTYSIKISQLHHVQGDPLLDCTKYTRNFTYNNCVKTEMADMFGKVLGCVSPWYAEDSQSMCNQVFNITENKEKQIKKIFRVVFPSYQPLTCKTPCTHTVFDTQFLFNSPSQDPVIKLIFEPVVSVTRSIFSISPQTLVGRLGGSVSSGRTLLWIVLTVMGGEY